MERQETPGAGKYSGMVCLEAGEPRGGYRGNAEGYRGGCEPVKAKEGTKQLGHKKIQKKSKSGVEVKWVGS